MFSRPSRLSAPQPLPARCWLTSARIWPAVDESGALAGGVDFFVEVGGFDEEVLVVGGVLDVSGGGTVEDGGCGAAVLVVEGAVGEDVRVG